MPNTSRDDPEGVIPPSGLLASTLGQVRLRLELQGVTLPSSLQSLTFDYKFDQDLKGVMLPSRMQTWTFVHDPNLSVQESFCRSHAA